MVENGNAGGGRNPAFMADPLCHNQILLWCTEEAFVLQPANFPKAMGKSTTMLSKLTDCLYVDRKSGHVRVDKPPADQTLRQLKPLLVYGCLGVVQFHSGPYLVVVTKREKVAHLHGSDVFEIKKCVVLGPTEKQVQGLKRKFHTAEKKYAQLLKMACEEKNLYFTYASDLTLNTERMANILRSPDVASKPLFDRQERSFLWNYHLSKKISAAGVDAEPFLVPVMAGSIKQRLGLDFNGSTVAFTLVARRDTGRVGTRYWRRGADESGAVANYVETEQILALSDGSGLASFVQCRGSIPIFWSQAPNIKYKPGFMFPPVEKNHLSQLAFDRHITSLMERFDKIYAINLVDQTRSERHLEKAYRDAVKRNGHADLAYYAFDFHKECGHMRYSRLSKLWGEVRPFVFEHSWYALGVFGDSKQTGVVRTNCVDCLDRTNVVQAYIARKVLEKQLVGLGILRGNQTIEQNLPEFEPLYRFMWGDHGDDISCHYSGTDALKRDFVRTGKRTKKGMLGDLKNSGMRYWLNNYYDGVRQDALDLFLGHYDVSSEPESPFQRGKTSKNGKWLFLSALFSLLGGVIRIIRNVPKISSALLKRGNGFSDDYSDLVHGFILVTLAGSLAFYLKLQGKKLVERPQLRFDQVMPW
mmetsp:Transcript_10175/g.62019  ORF Transcript_10175/g.62019 Transcript_10175/m.62019 type:complete len:642 (+) Transcript_10175:151-2076(+)